MIPISRRNLLAAVAALVMSASTANAHDDKDQIIHLMKGMFDTPDNPLSVDPIVVRGDNAIAGWVQGDRGGRALLWRVKGDWQIRLCSGDALKSPALLIDANISAEDATALVDELAAAEAKIDHAVLAKFSTFEGTMVMDGDSGHQGHNDGGSSAKQ